MKTGNNSKVPENILLINFSKTPEMYTQVVSVKYKRQTGLGNKLFPWSRAVILSEQYNLPLLHTIWFSPRGAGITRGGIDYSKVLGKQWL